MKKQIKKVIKQGQEKNLALLYLKNGIFLYIEAHFKNAVNIYLEDKNCQEIPFVYLIVEKITFVETKAISLYAQSTGLRSK